MYDGTIRHGDRVMCTMGHGDRVMCMTGHMGTG